MSCIEITSIASKWQAVEKWHIYGSINFISCNSAHWWVMRSVQEQHFVIKFIHCAIWMQQNCVQFALREPPNEFVLQADCAVCYHLPPHNAFAFCHLSRREMCCSTYSWMCFFYSPAAWYRRHSGGIASKCSFCLCICLWWPLISCNHKQLHLTHNPPSHRHKLWWLRHCIESIWLTNFCHAISERLLISWWQRFSDNQLLPVF